MNCKLYNNGHVKGVNRIGIFSLFLATTLTAAVTSHADLRSYDGFDYNPGALGSTGTGGSGWTDRWYSGTGQIIADSLAYTDTNGDVLLTTGKKLSYSTTFWYQTGAARQFASDAAPIGGAGQIWISYLIDPGSSTEVYATLYNGSSGVSANAMIGASYTTANGWQLDSRNGEGSSSTGKSGTGTTFQVLMIDYTTPGSTSAYLWINPVLAETPDVSTADAKLTGMNESYLVNRIQFASRSGGLVHIDEVRIGSDFASVTPVIPEGSTSALVLALMVSGVGILRYRRRR